MEANAYMAMQLYKVREAEMRGEMRVPPAVAEAILLEKQEILRARKARRNS